MIADALLTSFLEYLDIEADPMRWIMDPCGVSQRSKDNWGTQLAVVSMRIVDFSEDDCLVTGVVADGIRTFGVRH
jgi:hypothetical protein